jgi:hypothetical protein
MKIFYLTKEFIEKELGISNIVISHAPCSVINDKAVLTKQFTWNSIDELKNDDMFKNIKAADGVIFLYEMNIEQYQEFANKIINEAIKDEEVIIHEEVTESNTFVKDFNDAERFLARLFV